MFKGLIFLNISFKLAENKKEIQKKKTIKRHRCTNQKNINMDYIQVNLKNSDSTFFKF